MNGCKCDPAETYKLLKTGMVGGPAQIFKRYHEKDVTYIRSHIEREKSCNKSLGMTLMHYTYIVQETLCLAVKIR